MELSLLPASADRLASDYPCPDGAVPCKHLAAVFCLLAASFDEDLFAKVACRGREREELPADLLRPAYTGMCVRRMRLTSPRR